MSSGLYLPSLQTPPGGQWDMHRMFSISGGMPVSRSFTLGRDIRRARRSPWVTGHPERHHTRSEGCCPQGELGDTPASVALLHAQHSMTFSLRAVLGAQKPIREAEDTAKKVSLGIFYFQVPCLKVS